MIPAYPSACTLFPSRVLAGVLFLLLLPFAGSAHAANFTVSPVFNEIPADSGIAIFEVRNHDSRPLSFQVQAFAWSQQNGKDVRTPARQLLIVPPVVDVRPGETQLIRVALRDKDRTREHAYRVLVRELPGNDRSPGAFALKTLLAFDVPLFFAAKNGNRELDWRLEQAADETLTVHVDSTGSRHARFDKIRLLDENDRVLGVLEGLRYVLAGTRHSWKVPLREPVSRGTRVTLIHSITGQESSVPLTVE